MHFSLCVCVCILCGFWRKHALGSSLALMKCENGYAQKERNGKNHARDQVEWEILIEQTINYEHACIKKKKTGKSIYRKYYYFVFYIGFNIFEFILNRFHQYIQQKLFTNISILLNAISKNMLLIAAIVHFCITEMTHIQKDFDKC